MLKIVLLLVALDAPLFSDAAHAQPFPARPVRIVVGFPPGGVTDVLARPIAQKLADRHGVQFVVDNRPGATGQIANEMVAKAAADGYTLLAAPGSSITSYPHMRARMPYDSLKDLKPVVEIASFSYVLVAHPNVPARNVRELIALARARPGVLTYASPGVGTAFHLSGELLASMAGISLTHVPYKGGAAALTDMLGGRVDLLFYSLAVVQPLIQDGRLRALGVTGPKRMAQLPGVATVAEGGLEGYDMTGWQGVFAPRGTADGIVGQLNADIAAALSMPELKTIWSSQGMEFVPNDPARFAAAVKREYGRYADLIRRAGIKPD